MACRIQTIICCNGLILLAVTMWCVDLHASTTRYSQLESDALWLLKSPMQSQFKEGQRYKVKAFFNLGILHDEAESGSEFEIKNARLPILFKWSDQGLAKLNIGLEPLTNRFGPSYTDNALTEKNITRHSDTNLFDAWIQHDFSPVVRLRVGQDFIPYGLDSYTPVSLLSWINPSDWVRQATARSKLNRDIGIQLYGQWRAFNYGVAWLQGAGISRRQTGSGPAQFRLASDNNDHKDLAARVTWASPLPGMTLGASLYRGKQGDDDPASYLSEGGITDEEHSGFHAEYHTPHWSASLEYNYSTIDKMIVPRPDGVLIRSGSGRLKDTTVSMRYRWSEWLEPKIRVERFDSRSKMAVMGDPNRIAGFAPPHNTYIFGVNFNLKANSGSKSTVMLEYIRIDETHVASEVDNDRVELYWKLSI